MITQSELDVHN